jgi:hypothetical protein
VNLQCGVFDVRRRAFSEGIAPNDIARLDEQIGLNKSDFMCVSLISRQGMEQIEGALETTLRD